MKRDKALLTSGFAEQVARLYHDMEDAYDSVAATLDFSCGGCPDNCCDSFFLHHTYTEWAYLWQGLHALNKQQLEEIREKSGTCLAAAEDALARGERPRVMCPLNSGGRCTLYSHRLMICRLHGVPSAFTRPDGRRMEFPGCFRCQEQLAGEKPGAVLDRTEFFRRLVELEMRLLGARQKKLPKVKLTIAQMIVQGPPPLQGNNGLNR
jgi:hypothetical protein